MTEERWLHYKRKVGERFLSSLGNTDSEIIEDEQFMDPLFFTSFKFFITTLARLPATFLRI